MNPAGGEGLLNTAGATTETLPPDSNSNTTVLTYDHGQMAVYLLGHVQAALTRTMQLGRQQRVVILGAAARAGRDGDSADRSADLLSASRRRY